MARYCEECGILIDGVSNSRVRWCPQHSSQRTGLELAVFHCVDCGVPLVRVSNSRIKRCVQHSEEHSKYVAGIWRAEHRQYQPRASDTRALSNWSVYHDLLNDEPVVMMANVKTKKVISVREYQRTIAKQPMV